MSIQDAIDREAIRDCLYHLSWAVDRRDFDLLAKCYWPDASEEHGAFNGAIADFFVWLDVRTRDWDCTMFSLSQIIIDQDGDMAAVETYFRQLPDSMEFSGSPFGAAKRGARKPENPL